MNSNKKNKIEVSRKEWSGRRSVLVSNSGEKLDQFRNVAKGIRDEHLANGPLRTAAIPENPNAKTASDIVMEEQSRVLTEALDNTTMSSVSTLSRLHEKTFSRAEYSSNYGNLI